MLRAFGPCSPRSRLVASVRRRLGAARRPSSRRAARTRPRKSVNEEQLLQRAQQASGPRHHPGRQGRDPASSRRAATIAASTRARCPGSAASPSSACCSRSRSSTSSRGRITLERGEESGRKILRFNAFERFTHWLTATCLHRAGDLRPQLHLRQAPADAADRAGGLRDLVAMGEIRPQLPRLAVHARRRCSCSSSGSRTTSRTATTRLAAGRRRLLRRTRIRRRGASTPARSSSSGRSSLGGIALSVTGIVMLFPFSTADINGMQIGAVRPRHRRRGPDRHHDRPHLYRHARHGGRLRRHGLRRGRSRLGARSITALWVEEEQARNASGPSARAGRARSRRSRSSTPPGHCRARRFEPGTQRLSRAAAECSCGLRAVSRWPKPRNDDDKG